MKANPSREPYKNPSKKMLLQFPLRAPKCMYEPPAQPRQRPFLSSSRGAPFSFLGYPQMTHQMPLLHSGSGTQRNHKHFHLMCHQMPFWCGIRCKLFLENYGCGCVWAQVQPLADRNICGMSTVGSTKKAPSERAPSIPRGRKLLPN